MRILGIDPGIGRTGWGVIEAKNSKLQVLGYGCVETFASSKVEKRLQALYKELEKILQDHKPDIVAIEELFFNTNAKTALVVGEARGVVLLSIAQKNISVSVYTPLQVKIALTGFGRAEKGQVGQMVKTLL